MTTPTDQGFVRRQADRLLTSGPFRRIGPHVFPPFHRLVVRVSGGRTLLDTRSQPILMLTTTGARSGQRRDTPLAAVPLPDGSFYVVGSNFARESHPAWTANLLHEPAAQVLFRGTQADVNAVLVDGDAREDAWTEVVRWFPSWVSYTTVTTREFRIFHLVPTDGGTVQSE